MASATLQDLQQTIGGRLLTPKTRTPDEQGTPLGKIVTDSRLVEPGDVFWALRGLQHDGADFAQEAFNRKAAGVVVQKTVKAPSDCWVLVVDDTQRALRNWAAWRRRQFKGTLIAVTGSVGKTTTRQMIHAVLRTRLKGAASPRNYNNHLGVPLSMLAIEPDHDYAVLELGANSPGEIAALARLCAPKVAVITRVGDAHLGGFGSRQGVAEAKTELLAALPADGHAVLGADPWLRRAALNCPAKVTWIGCGDECELTAIDLKSEAGKLSFRLADCGFSVPVWGRHHLTAVLAAVAVGRIMDFGLDEIARALAAFEPLPMRCEVVEARGATIINDTYNSSPTAMQAALELLRDFDTAGRRIVVCGDMAELGEQAPLLHRQLGGDVVTRGNADLLLACGDWARDVVAGARAAGMPRARAVPCQTPDDALPYLGQAIQPGDTVLIKGSRIMAMERLVEALRQYPHRRSA